MNSNVFEPFKEQQTQPTVMPKNDYLFGSPWIFCRWGWGENFLEGLFAKADLVGNNILINKNKNLTGRLLHKVATGNYNLHITHYWDIAEHPKALPETIAHLLRSEKLYHHILRNTQVAIVGLHYLRDSGDPNDYALYVELMLYASLHLSLELDMLDVYDVRNLLNHKVGDYEKWLLMNFAKSIVKSSTRIDYLTEILTSEQLPEVERETALDILMKNPEFEFAALPKSWVRKTYGMPVPKYGDAEEEFTW